MKDIVIGAITNYDWNKIKYWVNSLESCGFNGTKAMVCYNVGYDVVSKLTDRGFLVFAFQKNDELSRVEYQKKDFNICLERFVHIWYFLSKIQNKENYRYLIATDVKDVIFQSNPSMWLERNIGDKKINVASESIRYRDEEWGKNNLLQSFGPMLYDANKDNIICNAGTISGEFNTTLDLFSNIFLSCGAAPQNVPGGGGPDQAALNVLLNMSPYKEITSVAWSESGYAAQLGTTGPQVDLVYGEKLLEPSPIFENGLVKTSLGVPFSIVHQYDRSPWKEDIERKYS